MTRSMLCRTCVVISLVTTATLVGCSSGSEQADVPSFDTTTSTTLAPTTTSTLPTLEQCVAPPAASATTASAIGDLDGDAIADTATGAVGDDGRWVLSVALSGGGTASVALGDDPGPAGVTPYGVLPLATAGGGVERVLIASVGTGASTISLAAFVRNDCGLERVLNVGGNEAQFSIGGSVTYASGITCVEAGAGAFNLIESKASSLDGESYDVVAVTYAIADGALVEVGRTNTTVNAASDPGGLASLTSFDCAGLVPPG